ncbi:polysaccharide export outer membrane protein [Lishizhenia tianjinensis]|uniref:Polysaccharide export outer membrane protein n=1 Tax=Lishizhenia tianjinensis TaxID=477690 RepID=A0A1I6ZKB5_9FLAO|nr:polysaccharide biosynthesis/export family protein [Lishizhenia tianjinensis]SFT63118.1 polysaccharide export outer membrane protein [Lishizhenia tianjinensis]
MIQLQRAILVLILLVPVLFSCKTKQKLVYFQGPTIDSLASNFETTLEVDDIVSIVVTADDPEQAVQFNFPDVGARSTLNNGYTQGNPVRNAYLINKEGYINFPVLGKVKIGGLERTKAVELLENKISAYINNPVVQMQIENFKVTVLGNVSRPGTFKIPNERITLLEAVGLAGDLKLTGVRKNVLVIREQNGVRYEYRVDLTSKELFTSPVYYLKQNDVIYVEPNMAARSQSTFFRNNSGVFVSIVSVIVSSIYSITIISSNN